MERDSLMKRNYSEMDNMNMESQDNIEDDYEKINEDEFFGLLEEESQQNNEMNYKSHSLKKERMGMGQKELNNDRIGQKKKNNKMKKLESLPLSKKLLAYLLKFTFDSNHSQDMYQKYAEDRIYRELRANCVKTIGFLIEIVNDQQVDQAIVPKQENNENKQIKQNKMGSQDLVKIAAAVQLGQINKSQYQQINMRDEDKLVLIQSIMVTLCNSSNNPQIKKHMSKALSSILEKEKNDLKDTVLQFIQRILQNGQIDKLIGSMICIESIISIPLTDTQIQFILHNFFDSLFNLGDQLFQICNQVLLIYQNTINQVRVNWVRDPQDWEDDTIDRFKVPSQELEDQLCLLDSWGQLMSRVLCLITYKKATLTQEMSFQLLNNPYYHQVIYQLINMQIKIQEQIQDCLISFTTSYSVDSQINSNLVNYLKIVYRFTKLLLRHRNSDYSLPENLKNTPFCLMLKELIPRAVVSLKWLNQFLISYGSLYNEFKVEESKNQIMRIVKQSLKISELQNYFYEMRVSFICDYIAPLLLVTDNDFEDFKKFGPSFLQYLEEFLNLQDKDKNKSSAGKLIIRYCKYVHGALTFFVQFFLENIHSIINEINENDPQFQVLNQATNSLIKQKYDTEKQLDMSIVTLICVRRQIKQRKDLIELVDKFLISNCNLICNIENKAISFFAISQLLIFFSEMADSILINNQDIFRRYIQLIIDCSQDWNKFVGFSYQVYKNIYDIVTNKGAQQRLKPIAQSLFEQLIVQIDNRKFDIYFECLNSVIQQYKNEIFVQEDILYKTINILIFKIFSSCATTKNKAKMHIDGVKMPIYILELIIQWDELSDDIRKKMDQCLFPLYQTLQSSKDHDLSVSVLKIFRLNLEKQNGIQTETQLNTIFFLKEVYEKEDIFVFEMYKIINYLIQQQPGYIVQNRNLFDFFLNLGINGMKTNSRFSCAFDKSLGCLVVHLMMHHFNTQISRDQYKEIIKGACCSIQQEFFEQYLETRLIEVILSCIEIDFQLTFTVLEELKQSERKWSKITDKILEIILNQVGIFQEVYDKKLYIIGCSKLLTNYQQIPFVQNNFVALFSRVLDMLHSIKNEQEFVSKQMEQKKNIQQNVVIVKKKYELNSFSDSSDDDEEGFNEDQKDDEDNEENDNYYSFDKDDQALREIYTRNKNQNDVMQRSEDQQIVQNRKKQLAHTYMQRDVQEMYEDPNDYKKVQKYMQTTYVEDLPEIRNSKSLGALEKNSDNSYEDLRKLKRAQKSLKLLYTPLKKLDEFSVFQKMFSDLKEKLGQDITQLTGQLTQYQRQYLDEILQTKRIVNDAETQEEAQSIRKIVRIRKRQQNQEQQDIQKNNQLMN